MKAIVMAGGMGTRLKPVSGDTPKPMVPLCGRPVMEYVLLHLKKHGITEVCAALKYRPEVVQGYFGNGEKLGIKLCYHIESEALGTAGAVRACEDFYGDEPFLVLSGDAIFDFDLTELIKAHENASPAASIALTPNSLPLRYGLALCDDGGSIRSFIEKPDWRHVVTNLVNTGIYILTPSAIKSVPQDRVFDFAEDLFPLLMREGKRLLGVPQSGYWCDIGTPRSYYECCVDAISGRVSLPIREDFAENSIPECKSDESGGCPCCDRARLMDFLSRCFLDFGADFGDGISFELGGERLCIAPLSSVSALKVSAESDSETARELVSSVTRLIEDAEKRLAKSEY